MSPMKLRTHTRAFYSLVILISFPIVSAFGFDAAPPKQSRNQKSFQHEVTVTLKLIQVYVTDKAGNPVTNLKMDDFEIHDRGKLKEITEFERHVLSLPDVIKKPFAKTALPEKTEEPKKKPEAAPAPSKMNRKFILFFDFAFNNAKGVLKSKEAALHFMDTKLLPEDEVAVLSYSVIHGLMVHEFLTSSHKKAREVIESFGAKDIAGRAHDVEFIYWKRREKANQETREKGSGEYPLADYSERFSLGDAHLSFDRKLYQEQASRFSLRMKELSKALRYIPGTKLILFFSSGIAGSTLYGKPGFPGKHSQLTDGLGETSIRNKYENMLKGLSHSNCVAYTINTEGYNVLAHRDADVQGAIALKRMSKESGGRHYGNVSDYKTIMEELQNITGSYYVLGYYVSEKWDGRYHKLDVKVKKKGCKVHAQGGYYERKPFTEYSKLEKQLHLMDLALTERPLFQDPVRFPLEAAWNPDDEAYALMLKLSLPEWSLGEVSGGKGEIVSLVFDEKDDVVGMKREDVDFSMKSSWEFQHTSHFSVHPGKYKCRVVIRNLETGRGAVGACEIDIPIQK